MAAKTPPSESSKGPGRHNRRREISGILLLAGGLFTGLSLVSRHAGGDPMMAARRSPARSMRWPVGART
jgi:hypothetical protein